MSTEKKWPPVDPETTVNTTKPNLEMQSGWTKEAWESRQWGVQGKILTHHDSHGLCYEVEHPDNTVGFYDPSEFEVVE